MLACAPECGCTLACSAPEELLETIDREQSRHVDPLAAAVVPLSGIAFGVLVGHHAAHRFANRAARVVFRSDQLEVLALAPLLAGDRGKEFGILRFDRARRAECPSPTHSPDAVASCTIFRRVCASVTSPRSRSLSVRARCASPNSKSCSVRYACRPPSNGVSKKDVEHSFDHLPAGKPLGEGDDVGVVVAPRQLGGVRLGDRRATNAGHLVGGHRDAEARTADDDAALGLPAGDGLADGVAVLRIIDRRRIVRAEIEHVVSSPAQESLRCGLCIRSRRDRRRRRFSWSLGYQRRGWASDGRSNVRRR